MNLFHKNHSLIYKVFLFVLTTFVIVYLFPKSGTFRYSFEKGKPWQSENLYAPFDFAIKKTIEEIDLEKQQIELQSPVFFDVDTTLLATVKNDYSTAFNRLFFELPKDQVKKNLFDNGAGVGKSTLVNSIEPGFKCLMNWWGQMNTPGDWFKIMN